MNGDSDESEVYEPITNFYICLYKKKASPKILFLFPELFPLIFQRQASGDFIYWNSFTRQSPLGIFRYFQIQRTITWESNGSRNIVWENDSGANCLCYFIFVLKSVCCKGMPGKELSQGHKDFLRLFRLSLVLEIHLLWIWSELNSEGFCFGESIVPKILNLQTFLIRIILDEESHIICLSSYVLSLSILSFVYPSCHCFLFFETSANNFICLDLTTWVLLVSQNTVV